MIFHSLIFSVIGILPSFITLVLINIVLLFLQAGEAPIHVAARYGHNTVIDYLCSVDADVNLQDKVSKIPCQFNERFKYLDLMLLYSGSIILISFESCSYFHQVILFSIEYLEFIILLVTTMNIVLHFICCNSLY